MAEYIERKKTVELLRSLGNRKYRFCDFLMRQPSVDAVPVIRCKDCTFGRYIDYGHMHCLHPCGLTTNMTNDFCSYAERKDGKQ